MNQTVRMKQIRPAYKHTHTHARTHAHPHTHTLTHTQIYIYKFTSECHTQTTPILGAEIARVRKRF